MTQQTIEAAERAFNFTATVSVSNGGDGLLTGIFVASHAAGTIKVADGNGTIVNTFSVAAATFYRIPVKYKGGLIITVGGTIDATAFVS